MRHLFASFIALNLLAGACLLACGSENQQETQATGTVSLPITATGSTGAAYRLSQATFVVTGGALTAPLTLNATSSSTESALTSVLPAGSYSITLSDNWQLVRDNASGLVPVTATLVSPATQTFTITNNVTTSVTFQFKTDSGIIQTGQGTLAVNVTVDDSGGGGYYTYNVGQGYAWTATSGTATAPTATISPTTFSSVTGNGPFCVSGTVQGTADYSGFALVGINVNQAAGTNTAAGTLTPPAGALVYFNISNTAQSPLRIQIQGPNGATDANDRWCSNITSGSGALSLSSFNTRCWDSSGVVYANSPVQSIVVIVPGNISATPFNFCINTLGLGVAPGSTAASDDWAK